MPLTRKWWAGGLLALSGCEAQSVPEAGAVIDNRGAIHRRASTVDRAAATPTTAAAPILAENGSGGTGDAGTVTGDALPAEVTAFRRMRDACDHFRGEDAYDAARGAFLAKEVAETCTGTDAALRSLRRRYASDPAVIAALSRYEDVVE